MFPSEFKVLRVFEKSETAGKGEISKMLGITTDLPNIYVSHYFEKALYRELARGE